MPYLARDVMRSNVITVPSSMDLRDLAKLFLEKGITGAPVVDDDGSLAGVISQTDLIYYNLTRDDQLTMDSQFYQSARVEGRHIPTGFQIEDCNTGVVADAMTPVVHSVTETASVESVARLMTRKHIHRVIVRKGRKVAGIISALDVLRVHVKPPPAARRPARRARGA
jgi:CBS domain-containing protein